MRRLLVAFLACRAVWGDAMAQSAGFATSWGNVYGRVLDAWGAPAPDVAVRLTWSGGAMERRTDAQGTFLLGGVPIPSDGDSGVLSFGAGPWVPLRLAIPPGAVMAPRVLALPGSTVLTHSVQDGPVASPPAAGRASQVAATAWAGPWSVFATREGLVGGTTANGHVITVSDRFVALPSRRALNASDASRDFLVELSVGGRTTVVPVLDVGPWNIRDDWWHDTLRESFPELPRGLPQAMAAFRDGHNGGLDGSGRKVLNGAGIDLGDGVFWGDLGMVNNAQIQVRLLWKLTATAGDRVRLKQWANVRATPGGTQVFRGECGEPGVVSGPPAGGVVGGRWYLFWPVAWDRGVSGWVVENFLVRESEAPACTDAVAAAPARPPARVRGGRLEFDAPASGEGRLRRIATDGRILSDAPAAWSAGGNSVPLPEVSGPEFVRLSGPGLDVRAWRVAP